jgi:hypothetical protein
MTTEREALPVWLTAAKARIAAAGPIRVGSDIHLLEMATADYEAALAKIDAAQAASAQPQTGDHVLHKPSGETWLVAMVEGEHLTCCGWPESVARVSDCKVVKVATADERLKLLQNMARSSGRRAAYAQRALAAPGPQSPAPTAALSAQPEPVEQVDMSVAVALDFADHPRPYHSLQAPADTNGELYRALKTLAEAYRATQPEPAAQAAPDGWKWMRHPTRLGGKPIPVRFLTHSDGTREYQPFDDKATTFEVERMGNDWQEPAAQAAQPVAWADDAKNWGSALNEAGWTFIETCPEKSALLFNNCKSSLREAILKYASLVAAQPAPQEPDALTWDQASRGMFVARLSEGDQDVSLTCAEVLALLSDCDMLASREQAPQEPADALDARRRSDGAIEITLPNNKEFRRITVFRSGNPAMYAIGEALLAAAPTTLDARTRQG